MKDLCRAVLRQADNLTQQNNFEIEVKTIQMPTVTKRELFNSVTNQMADTRPFGIKNPAVFLLNAAPAICAVTLLETVFRRKLFVI